MTVTVIGAGVAGLCVATELVRRATSVQILDQVVEPGPHACSWWAGGMLAPFCEGESAEEPVVRLGQSAADWWEGQGVTVQRHGSLVMAMGRDRKELDRFARRTQGAQAIGVDRIAELEPDLADRAPRALFFADEAHLDPRLALAALQERLAAQGVAVQQADPPATGPVIDCRGLSARDALTDLRGVKGEMLILRCPDVRLNRPVRLLHPRIPLYIVPRGEGIFMLGATVIEATERSRITARSMLEMLSAAYALHPAFGEAEILEIGTDARPAFPDNLPRIRRRGRVTYANGLFRHGFLLAPALAMQVADLVLDNKRPEFCDEDHPERGAA
ncbi:MAG: FAD-dependent oxidoreductase [Pseudomonadota bacterium]